MIGLLWWFLLAVSLVSGLAMVVYGFRLVAGAMFWHRVVLAHQPRSLIIGSAIKTRCSCGTWWEIKK